MIVLTVLLWTLLGLVGLVLFVLVLALALPFEAEAAGALVAGGDEDALDADGHVRARFGWGLLAFRLATGDGMAFRLFGVRVRPQPEDEATRAKKAQRRAARKARRAQKAERKRAREAGRPEKRRRTKRDAWRARQGFSRALGRLVRAFHLRGEVEGAVGLADPADTGLLVGLVNGLAANQSRLAVRLEPDWTEEIVRLRGRLATRFRAVAFVWIALRTFLDPTVRRAVLGRRKGRTAARVRAAGTTPSAS